MRVTETAMAATARCGDGPQKLSCLAADDVTNNPILAAEQAAVARLRLQYLARRRHALGQKPLFYFLRQVEALRRLLPGGQTIGGEWVARNPTRADRQPGSFKINLRTGHWAGFATSDKGGDLCAYVEGVSQGEAAGLLAKMLGLDRDQANGRSGRPGTKCG
jgi:hypothetical protein